MNLAIRDIRHHRGRFFLTSIGLGLLLGVVISMGGIYRGLIADALAVLNSTKADIWVVQQNSNGPFAESSRIPEDTKYRIAAVPGVAAVSPLSFQTVQIERNGKPFRIFLIGYELNSFGGPPSLVAGRNIRQKHYEMVVSKSMRIEIGEKIRLGQNEYKVVGISENIVSSSGDSAAYITLSDAQSIQFKKSNHSIRNERSKAGIAISNNKSLSPQQSTLLKKTLMESAENTHIINTVLVKLLPGVDLKETQTRIQRWNQLRAISDEEQTAILAKGMIEKARMQLGMFRIILLIISGVIISLIIYTSTLDKIRVIATLKLLGSRNRVIIGMILQQSLLMGLLAYAIGYILILLTYEKFPRRIVLETFDLQSLFVIVITICVLSSFVGIRKALKVEPAEALGG
ncbi:MAG: ABC transporter permease [Desulfuromonadaceae bacterium]|nr:ABC transporter permease [Desulfuromonadaceae bacterium]MDD2855528.1 ABC transporter permease [Desulfuromonadaceae bacterium]